MYKRFVLYIILTVTIVFETVGIINQPDGFKVVTSSGKVNIKESYSSHILLIPLDSRPPCTQFVEQVAAIARISVKMPPQELLDHYNKPADRRAIREWLLTESKAHDTVIVSVDMLVHGGLLASRLNTGGNDDIQETISLLKQIRKANPKIKLYVFSIIPRLLIADTDENTIYQKPMMKYSVQKDLFFTFENPLDLLKLNELEAVIPPEIISRYLALYEQNKQFNIALTNLTSSGIIDGLIIGQDDGLPFGLPNITKISIEHYVRQEGLSSKIFITRGTDEVALTMLGHIITKENKYTPKVFVRYSHPDAGATIMPFMPHSVETTVNEKIFIINGVRVESPEMADFILYVHIGTRSLNSSAYDKAARELQSFMLSGYRVGLVDLSEDYYASETLLPWLLKYDIDLTKLSSYAGWNTTSNTIGTVVTQMAAREVKRPNSLPLAESLAVFQANTEFLISRIIDDWYFQKKIQPYVNSHLKRTGIDPYHLGDAYDDTNRLVGKLLKEKSNHWFLRHLRQKPFKVESSEGSSEIMISDLRIDASLPWERTFEVKVKPTISLVELE